MTRNPTNGISEPPVRRSLSGSGATRCDERRIGVQHALVIGLVAKPS
jgi:hypothetical protein